MISVIDKNRGKLSKKKKYLDFASFCFTILISYTIIGNVVRK